VPHPSGFGHHLKAMPNPLPWTAFEHDEVHFWVHYGLCAFGFLLAIVTFIAQWTNPAPYGRHEKSGKSCGPMVHQRIAHTLSDATPLLLFTLVFFLYGHQREYPNITFYCLWLCHYVHRGFIHPWIMKYSSPKTPLGIPLGGLFPNLLYSFINADWIGAAEYDNAYYKDPRFIIGIVLFVTGFIINRYADLALRKLRSNSNAGYSIPHGCLFEVISCPNYFGEMLEWFGWTLGTWSLAGLVWFLFCCATFVPRARHNHLWYKDQFLDYPGNRKALIPFVY